MAGYILSTLDWPAFRSFVESPSHEHLLALGAVVSDLLDEYDGEFESDDPVATWPSEPAELTPILSQRLALADWYGDLSNTGKTLWDAAILDVCTDALAKSFRYKVSCEIYWDVIDIARRFHGIPSNTVTEAAVSRFGVTPFRCFPASGRQIRGGEWTATHSMHPRDVVRRMLKECEAIEAEIEQAPTSKTERDYEALMSTLAKAVEQERLLVVLVDT